MPLSKPQQLVAKSNKRFRVLITGRRFGKTVLCLRELFKAANKPNQEVWYIAPTYKQAKNIMWRKLKKKLYDLNWPQYYGNKLKINESELYVDLPWGSRISLKGADNFDSLRGVGINFLILDEVADIAREAYDEVLRPTLADKGGSALFVGTPKGRGNWAYELYCNQQDDPDDWESWIYSTIEGGYVTEDEIQSMRKTMDARTYAQEVEANFVTSGAQVWYNFDMEESVKSYWKNEPALTHEESLVWTKLKDTPKVLYTGWDFNIDPMSVIVFARDGDDVYAIDEIEIYGSNTQEAVDEMRNRYPRSKIWAYPDPACRQRKTSAGGTTDLKILQNAGYTVKVPHKHNAVRDGVNAVNAKLQNSLGERTFFVDPKCVRLIECLDKHNYKPGTTVPDKDSGYDHMTDAMRYYIDYVFPIMKNTDKIKTKPQRFGHSLVT